MAKFHHDFDEAVTPELPVVTLSTIDNLVTSEDEVKQLLLKLDPSKQGGEDGIADKMLKLTATSLAEPLSQLYNILLSNSIFPDCWKKGIVIPIYKNKVENHHLPIIAQSPY
jgi:hypothetical protein